MKTDKPTDNWKNKLTPIIPKNIVLCGYNNETLTLIHSVHPDFKLTNTSVLFQLCISNNSIKHVAFTLGNKNISMFCKIN
jgi:hypothetical protein